MKRVPFWTLGVIALMGLAFPAGSARAHEDIEIQVQDLTERIGESPDDPVLYVRRAFLHQLHGDFAPALADYARALEIDPEQVGAWVGRSATLLATDEPVAALADADRAVALAPADPPALHARARALARLGQARATDAAYAKIAKLQDRPTPDFVVEYANALLAQSPPEQERALEVLLSGIEELGPIITLADPTVTLHLATGDAPSALALCEQILAQLGQSPKWLLRRGKILAELGRDADARRSRLAARAAIDRLPIRRQNTAAMTELRAEIEAALAGNAASPGKVGE